MHGHDRDRSTGSPRDPAGPDGAFPGPGGTAAGGLPLAAALAAATLAGALAAGCGGGDGTSGGRGDGTPAEEGAREAPRAGATAETKQGASESGRSESTPDRPSTGAGPGWPTYGGDLAGTRFSRLDGVDRGNVDRLRLAWRYDTGVPGIFQATPIVVEGAMYLTTPMQDGEQRVLRLDARTGERSWERRIALASPRGDPAPTNRGVAVRNGRVYVATLDARLLSLDARTGETVWEVRTADPRRGYHHKQAPLVHDGTVYLGVSGGPFGIRGFVKAFDAVTGEERWTWHSVPSPAGGGWWGEWRDTLPGTSIPLPRDLERERADSARTADAWRRGGAAVWMTPSLDPERGRLFVGTGNPAPELQGRARPGDNRWSVSVCAIGTEGGRTVWCDQYLPHDLWGLDAASPPFLFPYRERGSGKDPSPSVPAVGHFSKLGFFYAWERESGRRLTLSENYVPHRNFLARPTAEGVEMAPGIYGGTEWSPAAWSPRTGLAYAASLHWPGIYFVRTEGERAGSVGFRLSRGTDPHGLLVAMDPVSGRVVWRTRTERPLVGGVLVTAGGLVFAGTLSGRLAAWDARTGERLWSGETEAGCASGPVTYEVQGRQFVAVACGGHFLGGTGTGDQVAVFALPNDASPDRSSRESSR